MRIRVIPVAVTAAALLAGVTCSFPDDSSDQVYVTIDAPALVVLDGDEMDVQARAWRTVGGVPDTGNGDDEALPNVEFIWYTGDQRIARVEPFCCGYATISGVGPGLTDITARVAAFEGAYDAILPLRVSRLLEIDSITPGSVQWGGKVTMWGVGVQFAFLTSLGGRNLIPDTLTFAEANGLNHMEFWVPHPARTDQVFVIGPGIFFTTPDSITVDTTDIYEPNDTMPFPIDLDAAGPYPTKLPNLLFYNPALAFEPVDRSSAFPQRQDYYRFATSDSTQPLTFILKPDRQADTSQLFFYFADSLEQSGGSFQIPASNRKWLMGSGLGFYICDTTFFFPDEIPTDSVVLAFKTLPSKAIQQLSVYQQPGSYAMAVVKGYQTADPRIQPDRFEENDLVCRYADANYSRGDSIVVARARPPFRDTLTIDNPHDVDWFRFKVRGILADTVVIRVAPRPFPGQIDRSDIDLYVYDASPNAFSRRGASLASGSFENLQLLLPPGDYYLAVVDYPGAATRYGLCMTVGNAQPCVPPASAATTVQSQLVAPSGTRAKRAPPAGAPRLPPNFAAGRLPLRRP
ncbi:MAG: hypothetical protein HYS40_06975 [Gemmatimonadetes bacterium]|nr:hypothetical protein [Gemmatimonadota bacterium]